MQTEKLKRAIDMLEAYRGDLEYWKGCGPENWVSCTSGTPTPHYKALSELNEAESQEAETFMEAYVADVGLAIADLQNLLEARS
jgi:hypothetical protein|tara:strand:- start:318 stop:569 length:252 start_codon:yes stop_codon:yes gene_type:complete